MNRYLRLISATSLIVFMGMATEFYAQSFKSWYQTSYELSTQVKRKMPALVNIYNKRIKIEAVATANVPQEVISILKTQFVTLLQKDTGFIIKDDSPETLLKFTITNFYYHSEKGRTTETGEVVNWTRVTGDIRVSYQAFEVKTNAPLDSENLAYEYDRIFTVTTSYNQYTKRYETTSNGTPPTDNQLWNYLVEVIVKQMAHRAAPMEERIEIPLPKGVLKPLSLSAQRASNWGKIREEAERMAPLKKADDDSYRVYLAGLGYEGMAYETPDDDHAKRRDLLFKAKTEYEKALSVKPKEVEYRVAVERAEKAVGQYDKLKDNEKKYREFIATSKLITPNPTPTHALTNEWNNKMVIYLHQSKTSEQELMKLILSVPNPKFDPLTPNGYMELKNAKIPDSVIDVMRQRMSNTQTKPVPAPTPTERINRPAPRRQGARAKTPRG